MLKMTRLTAPLFYIFGLCLLGQPVIAGVIYTWVDEQGVTHYSQQPPEQEQLKANQLYSKDIEPAKVGYVAPTKKEQPQVVSELEKSAALIKEKDAKQAQSICENAKHNLDVLTSHSKLIRQSEDPTKEPEAMSEDERQAAITQQQERIKLFCDKK